MCGSSWILRRAVKKIWWFFFKGSTKRDRVVVHNVTRSAIDENKERIMGDESESNGSNKQQQQQQSLCTICLDPLTSSDMGHNSRPIFTAQCRHAFHSACIAANVRHGSLACPVCRAHWTLLPALPAHWASIEPRRADPVLRILDDSIATIRVHRRSSLRTLQYDDDDPLEPAAQPGPAHPRLELSLGPVHFNRAHLSIRLARQRPTDVVLLASPNGPHLRLLKQSMALVIFSLRPVDRLAIVASVARVFPLRLMSAHGKRAALQVIDRISHSCEPDPSEGLRKALKILGDRAHHNPLECVIHISDGPTGTQMAYRPTHIPVHHFHVGFGFGFGLGSNGFVMHEFDEFLSRLLGGTIRETELRIDGGPVRLGELRGGEERRVQVEVGECGYVCVAYSYIEGDIEGCVRAGEVVVGVGDKVERIDRGSGDEGGGSNPRRSSGGPERWDYVDPFMARRWAKHLHGYRT